MTPSNDSYFSDTLAGFREPLLSAVAVRIQLGRWEPLVAKHALASLDRSNNTPPPEPMTITIEEMWRMQVEHRSLLIAARSLVHGMEMLDPPLPIDSDVRADIIDVRDLLEHWVENMPIFNTTPTPRTPAYRSGKAFLARHPRSSPYTWSRWDTQSGPLLTPDVNGETLRELADATTQAVLAAHPEMADGVPEVPYTGWQFFKGSWWPDREWLKERRP